MKALVYEGIKNVKVKKVPDPEIKKSDDVIVQVTSTAICGSDLHLLHGMIPDLKKGTVLGHETMGVVVEAGKDVKKLQKGDRVIVPFPIACGHCWYCEHGYYSQCDNSNEYGDMGGIFGYSDTMGGYDGGQAEYLRVPYANVGPVKVPVELSDEQVLFLTDILPTSYWGVEHAGVKSGDTVVVLGCGPVGLLCIKWALRKAKRVIAVDCIDYRLEQAAKFGAEPVNFNEQDYTGDLVKGMTHGGADVVIDCVGMDGKMSKIEMVESALKLQGGSKSAIELAAQCVRKCGTVQLVGVYGSRYNMFPLGDFFAHNITLKMGQCPAQTYIPHILDLIQKGEFTATDIITHRMSLNDAEKAYDLFEKKKDNCIKVVLKP
ncbi:MAG TPA: zinc-dependent alcohol dehydrogenase [Caproiciproducens sp.]|nr:zinc-dependent alcohol dehydrogenase [Caproiciproducens sp.]